MATFEYTARNNANQLVKGTLEAQNKDEAAKQLRQKKLILVSLAEPPKKAGISFGGSGVPTRDVVIFTRQFSTMINAGLPLVQSLTVLAEQTENKVLAETTKAVVYDVESGATLADAFGKHPKVFSELYVNMVAAGEAGGILDTILGRLAVFLEKNDALVRKVKGAMVYPGVIFSVAAIAITVLLVFVIPVFERMFASVNLQLPLPTAIVVGLSRFLVGYWWALLIGFGSAWFLFKQWVATPAGKKNFDVFLLKVPVLGDVIRKSAVSRFTRTLGTLISSGVSILDGLEITAKTAGNMVIHDAVMASRSSIAGGETISAPLKASNVFPPMVTSMISIGEQTGGLDEMLSKIADFYDEEVDVAVGTLLSLMEPIMIVVLGVVVGGMVVSMYLPIFDMINTVGD